MKTKIGILTFHDTNNFGSWLQTYALYKKISDMGLKAEVINYKCTELVRREKITLQKLKGQDFEKKRKLIIKQILFYLYSFKYIKLSKKVYYKSNIYKANRYYDAFIIGSDLVWDTRITGQDYTYMLDFAKSDKTMCSYAASLGYETIPKGQADRYKKLLGRFDYITVREVSAKAALDNLNIHNVYEVCDPTLLLTKTEWLEFIKKENSYGKYVLIYFADDEKRLLKLAKKYAHRHKCKVLSISEISELPEQNHVFPKTVREFLTLIYYAEKIFTASYHGMLFSINFEKQMAFCNREPKSRMKAVSQRMGLDKFEINHVLYDGDAVIDYSIVGQKLQEYRKTSKSYLDKILSIKKGRGSKINGQ